MKQRILFCAMTFVMALCGCQRLPEVISVAGVTLDCNSITLTVGESSTITATVSPSNADNKTVLWTVDDSNIASVSGRRVTALAPGETRVTAKTDDGGFTAYCTIKVKAKEVPVTSISFDQSSYVLTVGDSQLLNVAIWPENATNKNYTLKSSNNDIATIQGNNTVVALSPGEASITATTEDGGKTSSCKITVFAPNVSVKSVSLNQSNLYIVVGQEVELQATVYPQDATHKKVTWSASNSSVATVNNGIVRGVTTGKSTIMVKTEDGGFTASCSVEVLNDIELSEQSLTISGAPQTKPLSITSNVPAWAASSESSWIKISPSNGGKGSSVLSLAIEAHDGTTSRSGDVNFIVSGKVKAVFHITQSGRFLEVSKSPEGKLSHEKENVTLFVYSSSKWAAKSDASWLSLSSSSGSISDYLLVATAASNNRSSERTANITFSNEDGLTNTISITQDTYYEPLFTVSPLSWDFDPEGETWGVSVASDRPWIVSENTCDWLTLGTTSGDAGPSGWIPTIAGPNKTGAKRSGYIVVETTDGAAKRTVSFTQESLPVAPTMLAVTIAENPSVISPSGTTGLGNIFTVSCNEYWTMTYDNWFTVSTANGAVKSGAKFDPVTALKCGITADANPGALRTGKLYIKTADNKKEYIITVTQDSQASR